MRMCFLIEVCLIGIHNCTVIFRMQILFVSQNFTVKYEKYAIPNEVTRWVAFCTMTTFHLQMQSDDEETKLQCNNEKNCLGFAWVYNKNL